MKTLFIAAILMVVLLTTLTSCSIRKDFSAPIETLKTLQKSIKRKKWEVAALCFTEEIRNINQKFINKREFYFMETGTIQSLFEPVPIISKNAQFKIKTINNDKAIVEIYYPNFIDKDGRLKELSLTKSNQTEWKVDKISWTNVLNSN